MIAVYDLFGTVFDGSVRHRIGERVTPVHGTENCSTQSQYIAVELIQGQFFGRHRGFHQAVRAVMYPEHPKPVSLYRAIRDRADGGIQPRAVPAACQNANSLCFRHE